MLYNLINMFARSEINTVVNLIMLLAPTYLGVIPINDNTLLLTWTPPTQTNGITLFFATTNGNNPQTCEVDANGRNCTIAGLAAYTEYEVSLKACYKPEAASERICSTAVSKITKTLPAGR